MFCRTLLATALAATALAVPAPALKQRVTSQNFDLIALHSTSDVHLQPINANGNDTISGNVFYVGRPTVSYSPPGVDAPPGTVTAFSYFDDGSLSLDAEVPGGQQVYIDPVGALRFTTAHVHDTLPEGSVVDGWTYTPPAEGDSLGTLTHGTDQFFACPVRAGGYLIFVVAQGGTTAANCININLGPNPFDGFAAWQYE